MEEKLEQIIELLRENNSMLKEILRYVRKVDTSEYRMNSDIKEFCIKVIANVVTEELLEGCDKDDSDDIVNIIKQNFKTK